MGIFHQLRSSLENPSTPLSYPAEWLLDIFNGGRTDSGVRVSELTALQVSTIYAAVDLISGGLASLDLNVYEHLQPRGKRLAVEQDLHWLLHDEPNPEMTAFTFVKTMQCMALLWSNCYAEIERDQANRPMAIWPRNPVGTRPVRLTAPAVIDGERVEAGTMVYATSDGVKPGGAHTERYITADNMIHVPGLSLDGRIGKSVIELTRQVVGLALAAEKFGGKFFANGIRPTGVFELPNDMSPQAVENFRRSIQEAYGGENMLRPLIAESGIKWTQSDIKPNDAQFLETRRHQREEIGAIFHVPLRMLGDSGKVNRASSEQEAIEFVQYTLRPWIRAWQPELKRKLFPQVGRSANKFFPAFYYQDLLTPDAESRGKLISLLKQWGIGNSDDIRENFLDWNPIGGRAGKSYWMPVNMMDADGAAPPNALEEPPAGANDQRGPSARVTTGAMWAYSRVFDDAFHRIFARNKVDLHGFRTTFAPVLETIAGILCQAISGDFGVELAEPSANVRSVIDAHIVGMHSRFPQWKNDKQTAAAELIQAVRAVRAAVHLDHMMQIGGDGHDGKGQVTCQE
jgi:HK97 family phage portal protein